MKGLGAGFAYQEDNVLAEYNIPPTTSLSQWMSYHEMALKFLAEKMKAHGKLVPVASAELSDEDLSNPAAHVFGCDPDWNCWKLRPNPRPFSPNVRLRSAGGHIHIGGKFTKAEKNHLGRYCDLYLGLPSVLEDKDTKRRALYGQAGAIRFKPYGVEYRTLSNYWLADPTLTENIHERVRNMIKAFNSSRNDAYLEAKGEDIQQAINTSNQKLS